MAEDVVGQLIDILNREDVRAAREFADKYLIDGQLPVTQKGYNILKAWAEEHPDSQVNPRRTLMDIPVVIVPANQPLIASDGRKAMVSPWGDVFIFPAEVQSIASSRPIRIVDDRYPLL